MLFTLERYPKLKFVANFMVRFKILPMYIIACWWNVLSYLLSSSLFNCKYFQMGGWGFRNSFSSIINHNSWHNRELRSLYIRGQSRRAVSRKLKVSKTDSEPSVMFCLSFQFVFSLRNEWSYSVVFQAW